MACPPSAITSTSRICVWALSSPRTYCATCGTSSTSRRRTWSLGIAGTVTRGPRPTAVARLGGFGLVPSAGDDDRAVRRGSVWRGVVVGGDILDDEARGLRGLDELLAACEPETIDSGPATGCFAGLPLVEQ